ncbi:MAG TPA: EamA family transporter [Nitrolancea sp.]|jgi:drug/metabolite transporter (DMT)-like permease|nr:EamA family transporter [Nitrolancea sp.]
MLEGVALMLVATVAYNVSIILLAVASREESSTQPDRALFVQVARRASGAWSIVIGVAGWFFELEALTRISVTLSRVIYAAGFGAMLLLARWQLGERVERREAVGIVLIALGIVAVGATSPAESKHGPDLGGWILLLALMGPAILLPGIIQRARSVPIASISALGAGIGFSASNLFTKGASDSLGSRTLVPLVLLTIASAGASLLAFVDQIHALQYGRATAVVPLVAGLQAVIPITMAALFFGEKWPTTLVSRAVLAGGITLTTCGMLILAHASAQIVSASATGERKNGATSH